MVGAGVIGRTVLMAVKAVVNIREVEVFAIHRDHKLKFAEEMQDELGVSIRVVDSAEQALSNKDIIMTHPCQASLCKGVVDYRGFSIPSYVWL
jgi:ornithine cyclodeaminase/alanine dehydrogenase-like protein (mu-crystallin family)